jgi:hypothetical protein
MISCCSAAKFLMAEDELPLCETRLQVIVSKEISGPWLDAANPR